MTILLTIVYLLGSTCWFYLYQINGNILNIIIGSFLITLASFNLIKHSK